MQKNPIINTYRHIGRVHSRLTAILASKESVNSRRTYTASNDYKSKLTQIVGMFLKIDEKSKDKELIDEAKSMDSDLIKQIESLRSEYITPKTKKASNK